MQKTAFAVALSVMLLGFAVGANGADRKAEKAAQPDKVDVVLSAPQSATSEGSVSVGGHRIDYKTVAGTLVLHGQGDKEHEPELSMSYVAYFKNGASATSRPLTFIYNGGPGSATMWLHMGAFGPKRVVTSDHRHTPAPPYGVVNNEYSLLDVSDLVFIDAPGTGYGRLIANDSDKAKRDAQMKELRKKFFSVDGDVQAFAQFITEFLSKYERWNSPKYLFGESYGTTRSAVLANVLENRNGVGLNGVILLSVVLNWEIRPDGPVSPGLDLRYELQLPSFAATAFYHHQLPKQPAELVPFLQNVKQFALGDYAQALQAGSQLDNARRQAVAEQLHEYTGLPAVFWLKADLRVTAGMFRHELLAATDTTTGRLDTRFAGPSIDPMGERSEYDPQSTAIGDAYVAAFNDYMHQDLHFGQDQQYRGRADIDHWGYDHRVPGSYPGQPQQSLNVMTDLATVMKKDPNLKIYVNGGYFDTATPFFAAEYEMQHLPIPSSLVKNISYSWYPSGHMVYAHVPSLKALHDNVARFIDQTDNAKH